MKQAAGILFIADGNVLLLKRDGKSSHPREWAFPGGGIEEGETPEQAALREFQEECGHSYTGDLIEISHTADDNVDYTTFIAQVASEFTPKLNDEHTAYLWAAIDDYPNKTMPQVKALLDSEEVRKFVENGEAGEVVAKDETRNDADEVITELDIARNIRDKSLTSPQKVGNFWLFALRITGTGVAFRAKLDEYAHRDPAYYLTDEFLARCNGLPVIWVHPDNGAKLDTKSFEEKIIGMIFLPYIEGEEVWGIAKIFDEDAAQEMLKNELSTSPSVTYGDGENQRIVLSDGSKGLIEGVPKEVDHLAIVPNGVWDKGGEPSGIAVNHVEMTEKSSDDANRSDSQPLEGETKMPENTELLALLQAIKTGQDEMKAEFGQRLSALEAAEAAEVKTAEAKPAAVIPDAAAVVEPAAEVPSVKAEEPAAPQFSDELKARVDALEGALKKPEPVAPEEKANLVKAQSMADACEQVYGDSAERPLDGEDAKSYTLRMVSKHQARSPRWKDAKLDAIGDLAVLTTIAGEIYNDSAAAAKSCEGLPEGSVRAVTTTDQNCKTTKYLGNTSFVKGLAPKPM